MLNEQQKQFAFYYALTQNGAQAARQAGYSEARAKKTAWALLRREDIKAEVRRQLAHFEEAKATLVAEGEGMAGEKRRALAVVAESGMLSAAAEMLWAEALLRENALIAMGKQPIKVKKLVRGDDGHGNETLTEVEKEITDRNGAVANGAIALYLERIDARVKLEQQQREQLEGSTTERRVIDHETSPLTLALLAMSKR